MTGDNAPSRLGGLESPADPDRRRRRWHRRMMARTESGYTIIEAVVTVALVALVMVPLGRVLLSSSSAANENSARQQALGLDTAILAKVGATSYGLVGLIATDLTAATQADPSYSQASPGKPVTLPGVSPTPDLDGAFTFGSSNLTFNVVMPSVKWGDRDFKVITWVTEADAYVPACPTIPGQPATTVVTGIEREVTVSAAWFSQFSGWITATESTIVYPGGLSPYQGSGTPPPVPTNASASLTTVTGRIDVSWTASASAGCYSISWVTPDQAVHSTGLIAQDDPGYVTPPPSAGTGTAEYALDGLPQDEALTFFVTSYSAPAAGGGATLSSASTDSASEVAPSGPLVTEVTSTTCPSGVSPPCPYGGLGSSITVTGSGFTTGATMTLVQSGQSQSIGNCAASPCTLSLSSLTATTSGTWAVVATAGGISSPPSPPSDFTFNPTITSLATTPATHPPSGTAGTSVVVTGTNFLSGVSFNYSYPIDGTNLSVSWTNPSCSPTPSSTVGATSCTIVMPGVIAAQLAAAGETSTSGTISATNTPGGSSPTTTNDVFTYTA